VRFFPGGTLSINVAGQRKPYFGPNRMAAMQRNMLDLSRDTFVNSDTKAAAPVRRIAPEDHLYSTFFQ